MDFFISSSYIRYELYFLFANVVFLLFFFGMELVTRGHAIWTVLFPKGRQVDPEVVKPTTPPKSALVAAIEAENHPTIEDWAPLVEEEVVKKWTNENVDVPGLTNEDRIELSELSKVVRTKIARGELSDARSKIIEGLAKDKWHKELNCLLASLYERDNDYRKAEFIYKDLILVHDTDAEIYMKLGFSLSIQGKFEIAYEIYKKLLDLSDSHIEAAEMLANIAHELGRHDAAVQYSKLFLKSHPRNPDMLSVLSVSLIALEQKTEALEVLEKLKNLDPYNPRVREMKEKLELEIELASKFESSEEK